MTYDGSERRKDSYMNQEDHDMLLKTLQNTEFIREWKDTHEKKDDERFKEVNKRLFWVCVAVLVVASATGILPEVLKLFKP